MRVEPSSGAAIVLAVDGQGWSLIAGLHVGAADAETDQLNIARKASSR